MQFHELCTTFYKLKFSLFLWLKAKKLYQTIALNYKVTNSFNPNVSLSNGLQISSHLQDLNQELNHDTYLSIANHRSFKSTMHAQDGGLRGVDNGGSKEGPENSTIGNSEGSSVHILHGQLIFLGLLSENHDTFFNVGVVHIMNVSEYRHHQSLESKQLFVL